MVNVPGTLSQALGVLSTEYGLASQTPSAQHEGGTVRLEGIKSLPAADRTAIVQLLESKGLRGAFETSRSGRKEFLVIDAPSEGRVKRLRDGSQKTANAEKKLKTAAPGQAKAETSKTKHLAKDILFRNLLDLLGTDKILKSMAKHLGEPKCEISAHDPNSGGRATRNWIPPNKEWVGLRFDGAHWKGYRDGKAVADSYSANVQLSGTNNFCQSFACLLLAKRGVENTGLEAGKYGENIQKMSKEWLTWLDKPANAKAVKAETKAMAEEMENGEKIYPEISLPQIREILTRLVEDLEFAKDLSVSKE